MIKAFNLVKWSAVLGKDPQNFLGASWIPAFLAKVPEKSKRKWALRILDLSPHYFLSPDHPKYKGLAKDEYLEAVYADSTRSREDIYDEILGSEIEGADTVIDYGCGPGFLAKAVSPHVGHIYAVDISEGALACAEIVNGAPNISYLKADENGIGKIPDGSADAAYTFAVLQHLTDEVAAAVIETVAVKLKPGGKLAAHVQLANDLWKTEQEWRSDRSLKGRLKFRYGLHCFGRSRERYAAMLTDKGFEDLRFESLSDLVEERGDPLAGQCMIFARRNAIG